MLKKSQMPDKHSAEDILKQLRQVATMVIEAAEADTIEQVLRNIAHIARELIGAKYAALGVPNSEGGFQFFQVSGMSRSEIQRIDHPPVGLGLLGKMLEDADPMRLKHMAEHPSSVGFPEGHPKMDSFMGVPIKLGNQLHGIFYLTDKENGELFTEDDEWLLEILSGYVAMVIAEKLLQDQRRQITLMREREHIGMALHDGVIQSIYALGMRLDVARRTGNITEDDVDFALNGLNQVIEDIRGAIFQLRDQNNNTLTLRRRFQRVLSQLYLPEGLEVALDLPEHPILLPGKMYEALEMMVTECLSNVIRHANASHVVITVRDTAKTIQVVVADDGDGFDRQHLEQHSGLGLRNLERRARIHGGSVTLKSIPDEGTTVKIRMPTE